MKTFSRLAVNAALVIGLLVPELALAAPVMPFPKQAGHSAIIQTGGVVCDLDGCRDYSYRARRRVYVDPPVYGDQYGDEDMSGYSRRYRPRTRIYVDPPAPVYVPQRVYRPPVMDMSGDHVQWCLNRYRSYNPRTDRYMVRRGVYRHCISPYS